MTQVTVIQVDAFTNAAFAGNPAAVALFDELPSDVVLQQIALEMNLSETAFPIPRPDGTWDLRWFTPATEVDMCGHATLATAAALASRGLIDDAVTFHTRSGPLHCSVSGSRVSMDFPASPATEIDVPPELEKALGTDVVAAGAQFDLVAQLASAEEVRDLEPDLGLVAQLEYRAVVVTAQGDIDGGDADFVSRVFGPAVGVPEDPVTGSAHTILAPWWADRLGRTSLVAHQVSARGGRLWLEILRDRVSIDGDTVLVLDGTLTF